MSAQARYPIDPMWRFFEPELRRRVASLDDVASFAERVAAALRELLPGDQRSMEAVAGKLGVSVRTFQRRLQAEGTSFQAQVTAVCSYGNRFTLSLP